MSLSREQRITLALSKSISASFSLLASSIIIRKIYIQYKDRRCATVARGGRSSRQAKSISTYHRMMLSISLLDVLHSFSSALSTVMVPPSTGAIFAHGTIATCAAQGWLQQLTPTLVIYMAVMNTYFMLKIRYNIPDAVFQRKYEVYFHSIPIGFFLITGIVGLSLKIFNAILIPELGCWIGSYPIGCIFTNTCTRGYKIAEYIYFYTWGFAYIWLFLSVAVVLVNSVLIYSTIRTQEEKNATYLAARLQSLSNIQVLMTSSSNMNIVESMDELKLDDDDDDTPYEEEDRTSQHPESAPNNHLDAAIQQNPLQRRLSVAPSSRVAVVQSSFYVASAFFTAIWIFLPWLGIRLGVAPAWKFFFAFMVSIVSPSQGVFNLFIFVRLQYLRLRKTESDWSRWKCVVHCLFSEDYSH